MEEFMLYSVFAVVVSSIFSGLLAVLFATIFMVRFNKSSEINRRDRSVME